MNERERLIKLLSNTLWGNLCDHCGADKGSEREKVLEVTADWLIKNGVIMPPYRVGGTLWTTYKNEVAAATVIAIYVDGAGMLLDLRISVPHGYGTEIVRDVDVADVFLTEKEAEAAWKEKNT